MQGRRWLRSEQANQVNVVAIARLFLSVVDGLVGYLRNKQLIDAGKAEVIASSLQSASRELRLIHEARDKFKRDPDYRKRVRDSYRIDG